MASYASYAVDQEVARKMLEPTDVVIGTLKIDEVLLLVAYLSSNHVKVSAIQKQNK